MSLWITVPPEGGSIDVLDARNASNTTLKLRAEGKTAYRQWFSFRVAGARNVPCRLRIVNAHEATFSAGFNGYRAHASHDSMTWFRVPTRFDGRELVIDHTPGTDLTHYAYFEPHLAVDHARLIGRALASGRSRLEVVATTADGHPVDLLIVGEPAPAKKVVWILARQHPGETMGSFSCEGLVDRLVSDDDVARRLLERCVLYVVPNMNPDGSRRGHQRTNARGIDLNRAWREPDRETCPEVFGVRNRMLATGVDLCVDLHGEETLPYVFAVPTSGIPTLTERQSKGFEELSRALDLENDDFQTTHGYPRPTKGKGNLAICSNWVASQFDALALTLEQPVKDAANRPDPVHGWTSTRARRLGHDVVGAIARSLEAEAF